MRDHRYQPSTRFGQQIVFGARIGAIAGLLSVLAVATITAVTVGEPLDQLLTSSIPHLIDGVAAGAAVGAVAVALPMRETLDPGQPGVGAARRVTARLAASSQVVRLASASRRPAPDRADGCCSLPEDGRDDL